INTLRPRIHSQETKVAHLLFQASLQGIVVGIGNCSFPGVVLKIKRTNSSCLIELTAGSHRKGPSPKNKIPAPQIVNSVLSKRVAAGGSEALCWIARIRLDRRKQVTPACPDIPYREHRALGNFALNGEVEVLSIGQFIVDIVAGRICDRQVFGPDSSGSRRRNGERETVPHRILLAHTALVRLFEVNRRRTDPEQPERGIADLVEQGDVLDGGVVKTAPNADTSLARTAKDFCCQSLSCTR